MARKSGKQHQAAQKQVEVARITPEQAIPLIKKIGSQNSTRPW
jgi:hypothetical protein